MKEESIGNAVRLAIVEKGV